MSTIIYAILSFTFIVPSIICKNATPKIAVVGGGIGGTSCAYFLSKIFDGKAQLTLYEKDIIGGRLGLLNIDGDLYESGGSVIHPTNKHMMDFTKLLGLSLRKPPASHFGIFDGKEFVFRESDWYFLTLGKFLWRYGFAFLDLWKEVKSILEDFSSIYALQEKGYSFTTVNGLLEYMSPSFRNLTQESIGSYLMKKGYPKLLLEELVQSVMMVNYGQTNNMSAFAGFVSLAGADNNLWSVKGGNKMVPEGLLKESKASVVSGDVLEIINSGGTFSLKYNETSPPGNSEEQNYDIIVIAAPFIKGNKNIKFTNFNKDFSQYETIYHRTVATFVKGDLNPSAFNVNSVPEEILTFKNSLLFNSIGKVTPVTDTPTKGKKQVYKVFSQQPLTPKNIDELFQNVEILKEKDWLAYPEYNPPESLSPFMLYPGLYYINSVELSASAMEMSAVAGKNVALLAFNMWHNLIDKVDSHKRVYKDEL